MKDKDARPNAEELRRLNDIIQKPKRQGFGLSDKERQLLNKFRWSLTDQKGALTKFLQAVDWADQEEKRQAFELIHHWTPVDIDDALELLSKD